MFARLSLALVATLIALPVQAQLTPPPSAEYSYNPEDRFASPARAVGIQGATDAKIEQVQAGDLPEFIAIQAQLIAQNCTSPASRLADMKFYKYTADQNRRLGTPNYLIDLKGLAKKEQQQCLLGRACNENGECYLVGFKAYAAQQWERNFMMRQLAWGKATEADTATQAPLTLINVTSRLLCREVAVNGETTFDAVDSDDSETCTLPHLWLNAGLVQHGAPSEADLAKSKAPKADDDSGEE